MDGVRYAAYYCEENVWHLCDDRRLGAGEREVVLVSNPAQQVAMWCQRAHQHPELPVMWDYHAFVVVRGGGPVARVWDLDTTLGLDVAADRYLGLSFRPADARYAPRFRVVPADVYRRYLASDRRHMRGADGSYHQPPPPWPAIGEGFNLDRLIDMASEAPGEVIDPGGARDRWCGGHGRH